MSFDTRTTITQDYDFEERSEEKFFESPDFLNFHHVEWDRNDNFINMLGSFLSYIEKVNGSIGRYT